MPKSETTATERAAKTTKRLRMAGGRGDLEAAMTTFATDAVVHSPLTSRARFTGHAEIRALFGIVYANLTDIRYHTDIGDEHTRAVVATARVRGQDIEETLLARLNDQAEITELTLFIRPLPGLTAIMAALGPALARSRGRSGVTAGLLAAMIKPLTLATRLGDRVGVRVALPAVGPSTDRA